MAREVNILKYLIPLLQEYKEYKVIAECINPELIILWREIEFIKNNNYIHTSTEFGVKKREDMLKLYPHANEALDDRKFRLLAKEVDKLPYTRRALMKKLDYLCGEDGYYLNIDIANYTVQVGLTINSQSNIESVKELLENIVPLNMIINVIEDVKIRIENNIYTPSVVCSNEHYGIEYSENISIKAEGNIYTPSTIHTNEFYEIRS